MQFIDILPFLNAEIARVQKARDLLAYLLTTNGTHRKQGRRLESPAAPQTVNTLSLVQAQASEPPANTPADQPATLTIKRVPYKPRRERRAPAHRHKSAQAAHEDVALRSSVPAGPVVVSAEDVRRVQATRVEKAAPAPLEPGHFYGWRDRGDEARTAETLLQRWLSGTSATRAD